MARRSLPRRLAFTLSATLTASLALLCALSGAAGALQLSVLTAPQCSPGSDPAEFGLPADSITFPSGEFGRETQAWFVPGSGDRARAVIIGLPTGGMGRGDRMAELAAYARAGYSVLSFESRSCVGGAPVTLGQSEAGQVGDALAYLNTRPDIDPARIGLHGFSAGGAAALLAAEQYPQVAAVVAQGGYHHFQALLADQSRAFGPLQLPYLLGAEAGYAATTGLPLAGLDVIDGLDQIAPRPVLLIYGTAEPGLAGAREMAAREPSIALWEVAGATHGSYVSTAGEAAYSSRVVSFMDAALMGRQPA